MEKGAKIPDVITQSDSTALHAIASLAWTKKLKQVLQLFLNINLTHF